MIDVYHNYKDLSNNESVTKYKERYYPVILKTHFYITPFVIISTNRSHYKTLDNVNKKKGLTHPEPSMLSGLYSFSARRECPFPHL